MFTSWQPITFRLAIAIGSCCCFDNLPAAADTPGRPAAGVIRFAAYNVSLYRDRSGQLAAELEKGASAQAGRIAEVIQRVRPHVLLLNEFDYDSASRALEAFATHYLAVTQRNQPAIRFPHRFAGPVNTGRPSGLDLGGDGQPGGPDDAIGFGRHEGQYGMAVLSTLPIDRPRLRTFREFLWRAMPRARLPRIPATDEPFYSKEKLDVLRLSSKSFWDVPIQCGKTPDEVVYLLCSHPTPPVFDGPEDRNGLRNHDEIRLLADYVDPLRSGYLVDDKQTRGGLPRGSHFVIAGDLNADPVDGGAEPAAIAQLLEHPLINANVVPTSNGGRVAAARDYELNSDQRGDPAHDTADFAPDGHGNLRVDYVLPSRTLRVVDSGVFWPVPGEPGAKAISASDHRLVWIDVALSRVERSGTRLPE